MRHLWNKRGTKALAALLACLALACVLGAAGGRLARPEKAAPEDDRFVGFHLVYERMPQEGEVMARDNSHWVEYGSRDMEVEGFGTLALPKMILIGRPTDDPHGQDYEFPGLPGLNCFLAQVEMEGGGTRYAGTSGLADAHIAVGDEEESVSGTVYCGPPEDDRNWNTEHYDYGWTAYRVYQMEDGTVYLDGGGSSYGGMGGFTVSQKESWTETVDGESVTTAFEASFTLETVERLREVAVTWFDGEDRETARRTLTAEEIGDGLELARPEEAQWALVSVTDRTGAVERTAHTLREEGVAHRLIQLDERGLGQVVYLTLQ